tara:strand:+ start:371 stop:757 length:387 start_codon:yes stop_codon:yes gene_type:complete
MSTPQLKYDAIMAKHYPTLSYGVTTDEGEIMWLDKNVAKPDFDALWTAMKKDVFLEEIRAERNALLDATDKYIMSDYVHAKKSEYKIYRKKLRDLPVAYGALMVGEYEYKDKVLTKDGTESNLFPVIV